MNNPGWRIDNDEPRQQPHIGHLVEISETVDGREYNRKVWLEAEDDRFYYQDWVRSVAGWLYPSTRTPLIDGLTWLLSSAVTINFSGWIFQVAGLSTVMVLGLVASTVLLITLVAWMAKDAIPFPVIFYRVFLIFIGGLLAAL